jgi:hypothetical protein
MSHIEKEKIQDHLEDCQKLSSTELRTRYTPEANTHRNLLQRAKNQARTVHPDFRVFRDFLVHVGPRPCLGATLDRIDNSDPEYAPGKVRWADKRTQNSNKGDTLLFHYSRTGDTYTVSRLAKLQKVSPSTIRKRLERGWTDDEIIEGKHHAPIVDVDHSPRAPDLERPRQARDALFKRNAEYAAYHRAEYGEEYVLPDLDDLNELLEKFGPVSQENYDRHFAKWLRYMKPHLIWERLPQHARETIARIDPAGAALANEKMHAKEKHRSEL